MTLSSRGPAQPELEETEPDDSWLGSLSWRTGGAFLGLNLLAGVVGWLILRGRLVGENDWAIAVAIFCALMLGGGLVGLLGSWLVFRRSEEESTRHEWCFAGTIALVGGLAIVATLIGWSAPPVSVPAQSISEVFERANDAYVDRHFGLQSGLDIAPIAFVNLSLDPYIANYKELAASIDGEEHIVLEALVRCLEETNQVHMGYLQRTLNYEEMPDEMWGQTTDAVDIRRRQRVGDDAVVSIKRFDRELESLPASFTNVLMDSGLEGDRARALAEGYARSLALPLQRRVLAAELDVIESSLRVRSFFLDHLGVVTTGGFSPEVASVYTQYTDLFNEQIAKYITYLRLAADLAEMIYPGSEAARTARQLYDVARMDVAALPSLMEMTLLGQIYAAKVNRFHEKDFLWPESIRTRDQIEAQRAELIDLIKTTREYIDQLGSLPDRAATEIRKSGFSEQQIEERDHRSAARNKFAASQLSAEHNIGQWEIELELLALYDEQFDVWYRDTEDYIVFTSPEHQARYLVLVDRLHEASQEAELEFKQQFEVAPGHPYAVPQRRLP